MHSMKIIYQIEVSGHPKDVWGNHKTIEKTMQALVEATRKEGEVKVIYNSESEEKEKKHGAIRQLAGFAGSGAKEAFKMGKELMK